MIRPFILSETNWDEVRKTDFDTAILTWGATEAHNYHLPFGTDNYQVEYIAQKATALAWEKGAKVLLLPNIPFGVNTGQLDIGFCMNLLPSTQLAILKDVCDVLVRHNISKLVILNGHGANNFMPHIRELALFFPQLFICAINWFKAAPTKDFFQEAGDHADEMETSVMLHIAPELVMPLNNAGDGATKNFNLKGFKEGWAWSQRPWLKISKDTGSGNPKFATSQKGELFSNQTIENIGDFLFHLSTKTLDQILD